MKNLNRISLLLFLGTLIAKAASEDIQHSGCSAGGYLECHHSAICIDIDETQYECKCPDGLEGDGYQNGTGCGPKLCRSNDECHMNAFCNDEDVCECKKGYAGTPSIECSDIDECNTHGICHPFANCENTVGSYTCRCKTELGYEGNGTHCRHVCTVDSHCNLTTEICDVLNRVCVCKDGFKDVSQHCENIDECSELVDPCDDNANCLDTLGSYTCMCKNGFQGDGFTCTRLPITCDEILNDNPKAMSGTYTIDPDGGNPLEAVEVYCDMREGLGITVMKIVRGRKTFTTSSRKEVVFDYHQSIEQIKAVIESSVYCYQDMSYKCMEGARLLNGNDYWTDGNEEIQRNWGGAVQENMCLCGEFNMCENKNSNCNCNGTESTMFDIGKVTKRSLLPITGVQSEPDGGRGRVDVGDVLCAAKTFDIPQDCHEAKYKHGLNRNGPQLIDIDGPEGHLEPIYIQCDMETYNHVGVNVITHDRQSGFSPNAPGTYPITYGISTEHLAAMVENSHFCSQDAEYQCKNSRLLRHDGEMKGYYSDLSGNAKLHWPGGMGEENMCSCGILGKCEDKNAGCNCDIKDGKTRKDFGKETNKENLPVASVTLNEIDGTESTGTYAVGPLMCSQRQFGIYPSCQVYVENGHEESAVYLIDPDGSDDPVNPKTNNQSPFPAYCHIAGSPLYGTTIIYHEYTEEFAITGSTMFSYLWANTIQLKALTTRSSFCRQTVMYRCKSAPLYDGNQLLLQWTSESGNNVKHLRGNNYRDAKCPCFFNSTCVDDLKCNCDAADETERFDDWSFDDKRILPVTKLTYDTYSVSSEANIEVGPLECRELEYNCANLVWYKSRNRLDSEYKMQDGYYVVDPDGFDGVDPFTVQCSGTTTTVPVDVVDETPTEGKPGEPVTKCYTVKYNSLDGSLTQEQVQALVSKSKYCGQNLKQECINAPVTGMTVFSTCNGVQQTGWGGSNGEDKCQCGVVGSCAGGPDSGCNCDVEDGVNREDSGWIVDNDRLAVCEICITLDPTSSLTTTNKMRWAKPSVSDLYCDRNWIGAGASCQDFREQGVQEPSDQMVIMQGVSPGRAFPVACSMELEPPFGISEVKPKNPVVEIPNSGTEVIVEYWFYSFEFILALVSQSEYCTQELFLECEDSELVLTGSYGWYSADGVVQTSWAGNNDGTAGCTGGSCKCNLGGIQTDGGKITDSSKLAITKIVLGQADGKRTLRIGNLKCYDLYRSCEDIRVNKAANNPFGQNQYPIDPDQGGDVEPFMVECDFRTERNVGITKINVIKPGDRNVRNQTEPGSKSVPLSYENATPEQIYALTQISEFCKQEITYVCKNSPLTDENGLTQNYYETYESDESTNFGTAEFEDITGCPCQVTQTCTDGERCHCDSEDKLLVDYGIETENLPVTQLNFGGQKDSKAKAIYDISGVSCAPIPVDLPIDCQDAYERGITMSGEQYIRPTKNTEPFFVYCDMENLVETGGVTIIRNTLENITEVEFGQEITVDYHGSSPDQIKSLIYVSTYCYQPVKINCRNTKMFVGGNFFYWLGQEGVQEKYVGTGRDYAKECNCGRDGKCGGSEDRKTLFALERGCNCEAADDQLRADGGVFSKKEDLPVVSMTFNNPGTASPFSEVMLGPLYCSHEKFDIDECKTGFHDCHEHAECVNLEGTFECRCKKGYQGIGRPDVWANGRNCYNDHECAEGLNSCPLYADCTDTEGDFECTCQEGFRPKGSAKKKCLDIDECEENTHNCDINATCFNTPGSFKCRCNRNFRGDGTTCKPLGMCATFGDPHVITTDGKWLSHQGQCEYILSRDSCDGGSPTFSLMATFYDKYPPSEVTWVKNATLYLNEDKIEFLQNSEVRVNNLKVTPTHIDEAFRVINFWGRIELVANNGIEVIWDSNNNAIELYTPGSYANAVCGICGNFNGDPSDDLTVGSQCSETEGTVISNAYQFAESWTNPDNAFCSANCSATAPEPCTEEQIAKAKLQCRKVYGKHKHFKECLNQMDEDIKSSYHQSCIYDVCHIDGDAEQALCSHAKVLLEVCSSLVGVEVESFRTQDFCAIDCGEEMDHSSCIRSPPLTCADYLQNNPPPTSENTQCREGCICKAGLLQDGDDCVLPTDCGCIKDNVYYKKGEEVVSLQCNNKVICEGDNMFSKEEDITCHEFASCKVENGIFGCHCNPGYYGDGVNICVVDPCEPTPCGVNETCVHNLNTANYYECYCDLGFEGDCGNCQEIDECKSELNACPPKSDCINTVGSFKCKCHRGYEMSGGVCQDVNECDLAIERNISLCGENSRCVNKIGKHLCVCCAGYKMNTENECIKSSGTDTGERCCTCTKARCKENRKVCGTDHVTYENYKDMVLSTCEQGVYDVTVDYYGRCKQSCSVVACPKYQECVTNTKTGNPTCVCEECTAEEINSPKVCSSKFDVYENKCIFKQVQCSKDAEAEIIENMQYCEDNNGGIPVGPWGEWSPCSVTCGKGTMNRSRDGFVTDPFKDEYPLYQEADCYETPCPGPCEDAIESCKAESSECVVNDDGEAECECPTCENIGVDPVCGYVIRWVGEPEPTTWKSACHLQKSACERKRRHELYSYGSCEVEPVECARVPKVNYFFDDATEYRSQEKIDMAACEGGCGVLKEKCCQPSAIEKETVTMHKIGDIAVTREEEVTIIKECVCEDVVP